MWCWWSRCWTPHKRCTGVSPADLRTVLLRCHCQTLLSLQWALFEVNLVIADRRRRWAGSTALGRPKSLLSTASSSRLRCAARLPVLTADSTTMTAD